MTNLNDLSSKELVDLYNGLPNVTPVKKFKDKATALKRIAAAKADVSAAGKKAGEKYTREEWLNAGVKQLDELFFKPRDYKLPEKLEISCGFARGGGDVIGQCWDTTVTADGTTHMFVCPTIDAPVRVLDILLHEMIHACIGIKEKHGKAFRKIALEFGLSGKMTATIAKEGTELYSTLEKVAQELGKYPHVAISPKKGKGGDGDGEDKPKSKWIGFTSSNDPKYKVDANSDKVIEHGRPLDPWGTPMTATKPEVEAMLIEAGVKPVVKE